MISLRPAQKDDCSSLTQLAFDSEKYWGYDAKYMDKFKDEYCISEKYINQNHVFILEDDSRIVGFFALAQSESEWELEFFYVTAKRIRTGYGQMLWKELIRFCREQDIREFHLVTSPQAIGFYEKMGAEVTGETASLLNPKRIIPVLHYKVAALVDKQRKSE